MPWPHRAKLQWLPPKPPHREAENPKIWVFPKIRGFPPKWMVKIMENPIFNG